jgi:hypothetical protein
MRSTPRLLLCFCVVPISQALADDPPSQPASPSQTQQPANQAAPTATIAATPVASAQAEATTSSSSPPSPAPTASPAKSTVAEAVNTDEDKEDKKLRAQGYKVRVRNGEKYYCREEGELGSRLTRQTCSTAADLKSMQLQSQDEMRQLQNLRSGASKTP